MKIKIGAGFALAAALFLFFNAGGLFGMFLLAAAVHELGHLTAILLCRARLTELRFELTGAVICHSTVSHAMDALIAFAGPFAGAVAAFIAAKLGYTEFAGVSLVLSALNLLPAIPLDGGRIVGAISGMFTGGGSKLVIILHCLTCFGLLLLGLYVLYATGGNFTCLLLAVWLLFSFRDEVYA